jgi:hypothetical protein
MRHRSTLPKSPGLHPVLCFLHGYDEAASASGDEGFTRHGPLAPGVPRSVTGHFIVIVRGRSIRRACRRSFAALRQRDDKRAGIDQADETVYSWLLRWSISSSPRSP